jgi:SAM-dependent methyltransferase
MDPNMDRQMLKRLARSTWDAVGPMFGVRWKEYNELKYWRGRKRQEGELGNAHYVRFYTEQFGLTTSDYAEKVVLDIGCGPRGSLEWATMARRRVGLDPLANKYLRLGADKHRMEYVTAPAEGMPFEARTFDVVCSFNSLDHVNDVEVVISEIKRVTKPGGLFLLVVEVNHPPTPCEPHALSPSITSAFEPEFSCLDLKLYHPHPEGVYRALQAGELIASGITAVEPGWLAAKFVRTGDGPGRTS